MIKESGFLSGTREVQSEWKISRGLWNLFRPEENHRQLRSEFFSDYESRAMIHSKKHLLFIAYYFPPLASGGTLRATKFVKYLPRFGYLPHVLTVKNPHHLVFDFELGRQIPHGVPVHRTFAVLPARFFRKLFHHAPEKPRNSLRNKLGWHSIIQWLKEAVYTFFFIPDELIGWLPFAVWRGMKILCQHRGMVIFSTSPPNSTHLIAWMLKKISRRSWIADFRDRWDQYPDTYNPWDVHWKVKLDRFFEQMVLTSADRIVVISRRMKEQLCRRYTRLNEQKIQVIPNGYDPEDFPCAPSLSFSLEKHCILLHAGTVSVWRFYPAFFHCFKELCQENPEFHRSMRIQLMGLVFSPVWDEIEGLSLNSHIAVHPHRPYREILRWMRSAEYLLLWVGDLPGVENALAAKLFDYIGAGRPILALAPEGESADLIRRYGLGLVAHPQDRKAIRNMLQSAFIAWKQGGMAYNPPIAELQRQFDRKNLTKKLCYILDEFYVAPES